ncbi:MAG: hypothetical protein F6K54_37680 [Okeania sp. SIO3B5]|nr:hypothetical protein [Okeania sp. SIO3B5]
MNTFEGHIEGVTSVSFSADGCYALSGSNDKTLKLWDIKTGCLRTFEGHGEAVKAVCFSLDGCYILSGSNDGSMKLWVLDWELAERIPTKWDDGAMVYLETFLIQHTPYAITLPPRLLQYQNNNQNVQQILGFLVRLFLTFFALGGLRGIATVIIFILGAMFGARNGFKSLKFALGLGFFGVVTLLSPLNRLFNIFSRSAVSINPFIRHINQFILWMTTMIIFGVLQVAIGMMIGMLINAGFRAFYSQAKSRKTAKQRGIEMPGNRVWKYLKIEFGTKWSIVMLILTMILGYCLGSVFSYNKLNRFLLPLITPISLIIGFKVVLAEVKLGIGIQDKIPLVLGTRIWKYLKAKLGTIRALVILAMTVILMIIGLGLTLIMKTYLFFLTAVLIISLPLIWMIFYLPLGRLYMISKYRYSEKNRIKP